MKHELKLLIAFLISLVSGQLSIPAAVQTTTVTVTAAEPTTIVYYSTVNATETKSTNTWKWHPTLSTSASLNITRLTLPTAVYSNASMTSSSMTTFTTSRTLPTKNLALQGGSTAVKASATAITADGSTQVMSAAVNAGTINVSIKSGWTVVLLIVTVLFEA